MATGSSSYDGLAMGLFGEWELTQQIAATDFLTLTGAASISGDFFVCRDSDETELTYIDSRGVYHTRCTTTEANRYHGVDARGEVLVEGAAGVQIAVSGELKDSSDESGVWQNYPAFFYFTGASCASMSGGRTAGVAITFNMASDYDGVSAGSCSFINFSDSSTQNVPSLFTFPGMTTASTIFDALSTTASTHSLKIHIGSPGAAYYIMLTTCVP